MPNPIPLSVPRGDMLHIKEALESIAAEVEQLELDEEWYSSDSTDLLKSATEIVYGHLGIEMPTEDDDEDDYEEVD